jgi:hypothetical protein
MHDGLPVKGYKPQNQEKIDLVNANKELEERCLRQAERIKADPNYDGRMAALAFTHIQDAFMWLNRAVFQPARVSLPEDSR